MKRVVVGKTPVIRYGYLTYRPEYDYIETPEDRIIRHSEPPPEGWAAYYEQDHHEEFRRAVDDCEWLTWYEGCENE